MKTTVVTRISINASHATIYKYLTDLSLHPVWNPQMESISSSEKLELGYTYETSASFLGIKITATNLVTKLIPDVEVEITNNTGMVQYRANYRIRDKNGMPQVVCKISVSSESKSFAFAKPILGVIAHRELRTDLRALKLAAENNLTAIN